MVADASLTADSKNFWHLAGLVYKLFPWIPIWWFEAAFLAPFSNPNPNSLCSLTPRKSRLYRNQEFASMLERPMNELCDWWLVKGKKKKSIYSELFLIFYLVHSDFIQYKAWFYSYILFIFLSPEYLLFPGSCRNLHLFTSLEDLRKGFHVCSRPWDTNPSTNPYGIWPVA